MRPSEVEKEPARRAEVETEIGKHNVVDVGLSADKQHIRPEVQKELEKKRTEDRKLTQAETEAELIRLLERLQQSRVDQHPGEKVSTCNTQTILNALSPSFPTVKYCTRHIFEQVFEYLSEVI